MPLHVDAADIADVPNILVSLARRDDRRARCLPQFSREGLRVDLLDALTGEDAARVGMRALPWLGSGAVGTVASHREAWRRIAISDAPFGVVYEDDVVLADGFRAHASRAVSEAPDWDIVQFGWFTSVRYPLRARVTTSLRSRVVEWRGRRRVTRSLFRDGAHAYAIRSSLAHQLADFVDSAPCGVDVLLQVISHTRSVYVVEPTIASQTASYSDVENRDVGPR
jgi:GR25 family glycosyltransferase involved in LPS biosynthesis